jgi:hypothetical protein
VNAIKAAAINKAWNRTLASLFCQNFLVFCILALSSTLGKPK